MFHKKLLALFLPISAVLVFTPATASAGVEVTLTISAAPPTTITVGGSVTFTLVLTCNESWTTATAQLFNGTTISNENKLGSSFDLEYPTGQIQAQSASRPANGVVPVSTTKTLTFNQVGTYTISASITEAVYNDGSNIRAANGCEVPSVSTQTIEVQAAPDVPPVVVATTTTSTAVTTTSTATSSLPKTGTDSNNALIALAVMTAGVAIIAGRRRLLTK